MADKKNGNGGATASPKGSAAGMTKMEAVRQALAKQGPNARPMDLRDYIKKTFGIDMSTDHISTCKGDIARKKAKPKVMQSAAKQPAAKFVAQTPVAPTAPARQATTQAAGGISVADVDTVKTLVRRVGREISQGLDRRVDQVIAWLRSFRVAPRRGCCETCSAPPGRPARRRWSS